MSTAGQRVHLMGIGGSGMSPIAKVLIEMGENVSGCDLAPTEATERLGRLGATITIGHDPAHLAGVDRLIVSTAIASDNPELVEARRLGIPVFHRSEILAELLNARKGIAVAGAHGKTTITSMISLILERAGLHPTVLIGGQISDFEGGAKYGSGPFLVAEADESDRSFLRYRPYVAVVTSLDPDHLEYYGGSPRELESAYLEFVESVVPGGRAILCVDDGRLRQMAGYKGIPAVTYALEPPADYTAECIELHGRGASFVARNATQTLGEFRLSVPGRHNVANALATLAVCRFAGVSPDEIAHHLESFRGAKRRFEVIADAAEVMVVDDYAHHPEEIKATLAAARAGYPARRIIAVFQPHRYTRTHFLMNEFAGSFRQVDYVMIADVYSPPPEEQIPGVSGERLAKMVAGLTEAEVHFSPTPQSIAEELAARVQPGDLVITMGAGDIWKTAHLLKDRLAARG